MDACWKGFSVQAAVLQVPEKGEPAVPSFALVIMDVDTVDYVLLPNLRLGYTSTLEADGKRSWSEQELNP